MNIFDSYLDKIKELVIKLNIDGSLIIPDSLEALKVDLPPENMDFDISTNVAMILAKINEKSPNDLANQLSGMIKNNDKNIQNINVAKPGFINIKFKDIFWNNFLENIITDNKNFGVSKKETKNKYLIEFVSANPTGPLHVGHCRGAILGDVISNILTFNKHKVTKEYYVNDYGNQIINFTKSVYLRIKEIMDKEPFPITDADLYPGDYIIDIAKKIIKKKSISNFSNFKKIYEKLSKESLNLSMNYKL